MPFAPLISLLKRYFAMLSCGFAFFAINPAPDLVDIYELALINDPTLQAAQASFNASQEIKTKAMSQLLPQISGQAIRKPMKIIATCLTLVASPFLVG